MLNYYCKESSYNSKSCFTLQLKLINKLSLSVCLFTLALYPVPANQKSIFAMTSRHQRMPFLATWWHQIYPALSHLLKSQRPSAATTSPREPSSRNVFIFTSATKKRERLSRITMPRSGNSLHIASLEKPSRILSEIVSYAAYGTKPSNADCCQKKPSPITRPWRRRELWKPPTRTPRLSRAANRRYGNSQPILPEPLRKRIAAIIVDGRTIRQLNANSKTPNVTTAGRRDISHRHARIKREAPTADTLAA